MCVRAPHVRPEVKVRRPSTDADQLVFWDWGLLLTVPGWLVKELLGSPCLWDYKCMPPSLPPFSLFFMTWVLKIRLGSLCFYGGHFINRVVSPGPVCFLIFDIPWDSMGTMVSSRMRILLSIPFSLLALCPILHRVALVEMLTVCWMWVVRADIVWWEGK